MSRATVGFAVIGLAAGLLAVGLWLQHQTTAQLRRELALVHEQQREVAAAKADHARLIAAATPDVEVQRLRDDRAALGRLRAELEDLKSRAAAKAAKVDPPAKSPRWIPASEWKNAGRATPAATIETALWAAAGGDLDALAGALRMEDAVRAKAVAILAGLPTPTRAQYRTPEHFAALFTAKDIPTESSMQITGQKELGADQVSVAVMLQGGTRAQGRVIMLQRSIDGWQLVVPEGAIDKYAAMLKGPRAALEGK